MKRLLQIQRIGAFGLLIALVGACVSETEPLLEPDQIEASIEIIEEEGGGGENLRRGEDKSRAYFEKFQNNLTIVPTESFDPNTLAGALVPGLGTGHASSMGNAKTFLNQLTQVGPNGLETIGAPVTDIPEFKVALEKLEIEINDSRVHSVTADSEGNSIWFENRGNVVTQDIDGRFYFEAEVEVIGGTGKFKGITGGKGKVEGFFDLDPGDPQNGILPTGQGTSIISARLSF